MAPTHVQILEVGALHEPPLSGPSATLSPPCGERAGRGVPIRFMVPMHAEKRKRAPHEPDFGRYIALRCPRRESAGGIVAPLNAARTAQRAVPTRFRGSMRENLFRRIHFLILSE